VQTLDATVAAQDRVLADLRREFEQLRRALEGVRVSLDVDTHDEPPPPHY